MIVTRTLRFGLNFSLKDQKKAYFGNRVIRKLSFWPFGGGEAQEAGPEGPADPQGPDLGQQSDNSQQEAPSGSESTTEGSTSPNFDLGVYIKQKEEEIPKIKTFKIIDPIENYSTRVALKYYKQLLYLVYLAFKAKFKEFQEYFYLLAIYLLI